MVRPGSTLGMWVERLLRQVPPTPSTQLSTGTLRSWRTTPSLSGLSSSGYGDSWSGSEASDDGMTDGFFLDPAQNVEIIPLVSLRVDMAAHFK